MTDATKKQGNKKQETEIAVTGEKLDLRKNCTGNESNKTLSDMFCKKK